MLTINFRTIMEQNHLVTTPGVNAPTPREIVIDRIEIKGDIDDFLKFNKKLQNESENSLSTNPFISEFNDVGFVLHWSDDFAHPKRHLILQVGDAISSYQEKIITTELLVINKLYQEHKPYSKLQSLLDQSVSFNPDKMYFKNKSDKNLLLSRLSNIQLEILSIVACIGEIPVGNTKEESIESTTADEEPPVIDIKFKKIGIDSDNTLDEIYEVVAITHNKHWNSVDFNVMKRHIEDYNETLNRQEPYIKLEWSPTTGYQIYLNYYDLLVSLKGTHTGKITFGIQVGMVCDQGKYETIQKTIKHINKQYPIVKANWGE